MSEHAIQPYSGQNIQTQLRRSNPPQTLLRLVDSACTLPLLAKGFHCLPLLFSFSACKALLLLLTWALCYSVEVVSNLGAVRRCSVHTPPLTGLDVCIWRKSNLFLRLHTSNPVRDMRTTWLDCSKTAQYPNWSTEPKLMQPDNKLYSYSRRTMCKK